jgi:hypothetical protein
MATFEELDRLPSKELHDRAVKLARHRLDMRWLWQLMEAVPAAEVAAGDREAAYDDELHVVTLLDDAMEADEGDLADALRPMYIDYLLKHEKS